jgi:hypothetical protein
VKSNSRAQGGEGEEGGVVTVGTFLEAFSTSFFTNMADERSAVQRKTTTADVAKQCPNRSTRPKIGGAATPLLVEAGSLWLS